MGAQQWSHWHKDTSLAHEGSSCILVAPRSFGPCNLEPDSGERPSSLPREPCSCQLGCVCFSSPVHCHYAGYSSFTHLLLSSRQNSAVDVYCVYLYSQFF